MTMRVMCFRLEVRPEHRDRLVEALLADGRGSLAEEPGTLRFDVIQDPDDRNRLYLYEAYANEAAFEAHKQGPWFKLGMDVLRPLLDAGHCTSERLLRGNALFP